MVGLSWDPPQRARTISGYRIRRDGTDLAVSPTPRFVDTSVAASSRYSYSVIALGGYPGALVQSVQSTHPLQTGSSASSGSDAEVGSLSVTTPAASPSGDAPYCHSPEITSISWNWRDGHHLAQGSDLWPVTWGRNGKVYAFFGDGGGVGGGDHRGRASFGIAEFSGSAPPTAANTRNVYGGANAVHPSRLDGKAGAIIAIGSDFYTLGGIYGPSRSDPGPRSGSPKRVQLAYSKGNAYTWQVAHWQFCAAEPTGRYASAGRFCPVAFVNFGPGNSAARDGYVYLLGLPDSASFWRDTPDSGPGPTYLARVPRRRLLVQTDYRYFAGMDAAGKPLWSAEAARMQPVFTDRNPSRPGCQRVCVMASALSDVVYDTKLQRYIGTAQGVFLGQTSFYDAPEPWGPWTAISYNNIDPASGSGGWANLGTAAGISLGVHIVNAWTSDDGLTLWMTYSSNGHAPPGALFPPAGSPMDSLNLVQARLSVPGSLSSQPP